MFCFLELCGPCKQGHGRDMSFAHIVCQALSLFIISESLEVCIPVPGQFLWVLKSGHLHDRYCRQLAFSEGGQQMLSFLYDGRPTVSPIVKNCSMYWHILSIVWIAEHNLNVRIRMKPRFFQQHQNFTIIYLAYFPRHRLPLLMFSVVSHNLILIILTAHFPIEFPSLSNLHNDNGNIIKLCFQPVNWCGPKTITYDYIM